MSVRVISAVWDSGLCSGNTLLALLALADWSDDQGVSFPGIPALAKKSRQSERNMQYCLRELRNAGLLTQELDEKGRRNYRIDLQKLRRAKIAPVQNATSEGCKTEHVGVQNTTLRGAKCDIAIRKNRHEPPRTVIKQPSGGKVKTKLPGDFSRNESFELSKKLAHDLGIPLVAANLKAIEAALKAESSFSQLSLASAALLIFNSASRDRHFLRSGKPASFYFADAEYRNCVKYLVRQLEQCEIHPTAGRTDHGTCYGCYARWPGELHELADVAKAVGQ